MTGLKCRQTCHGKVHKVQRQSDSNTSSAPLELGDSSWILVSASVEKKKKCDNNIVILPGRLALRIKCMAMPITIFGLDN